jgi:purine-binding chemotaxis protein CheW
LIIADTSRRTVAMLVDSAIDVIERPGSDVMPMECAVDQSDQIDGVVRLPDGLLLIHDLEKFLSQEEELLLQEAMTREA